MQKHKAIIAFDFDDTIVHTQWPTIVGFRPFAKQCLQELHDAGCFIIIHTCRSKEHEAAAAQFLKDNGVHFDLINANHPQLIQVFEADCRKISADVYVDDKNIQSLMDPASHDLPLVASQIAWLINQPGFKSMLDIPVAISN